MNYDAAPRAISCDVCHGSGRLRTSADPRNEDPSVECEGCEGAGTYALCVRCEDVIPAHDRHCAGCAADLERDDERTHALAHGPEGY